MGVTFRQVHLSNVIAGTDTPFSTLGGPNLVPVLAGNLLVIGAMYDAGLICNSVTDSNGNPYAKAIELTHIGSNPWVEAIWYSTNVSVAVFNVPTITLHLSGITNICLMAIAEYTGQIQDSNAAVLGNTNTGNCNSSCGASPIAMSTGSISASNSSAVCILGQVNSGSISVNFPWSDHGGSGTNLFTGQSLSDRTSVVAGSYAGSMTDTGLNNDDWSMLIVEFKAPGSPIPPPTTSTLRGPHRSSRVTPPYNP
jgi:hypothetical protein